MPWRFRGTGLSTIQEDGPVDDIQATAKGTARTSNVHQGPQVQPGGIRLAQKPQRQASLELQTLCGEVRGRQQGKRSGLSGVQRGSNPAGRTGTGSSSKRHKAERRQKLKRPRSESKSHSRSSRKKPRLAEAEEQPSKKRKSGQEYTRRRTRMKRGSHNNKTKQAGDMRLGNSHYG